MSVRIAPKTEVVARSVPRQDGGYLVVTRKGNSGSSPTEIHEGARVVIVGGRAMRSDP